jgi:predicted nucleic acid-binding protein
MNVVDSSGWLEYFSSGPNAEFFAQPLFSKETLYVPAICIYEVFKKTLQETGDEDKALEAAAQMIDRGKIVDLDQTVALEAARLGYQLSLALADSVVLAVANIFEATLWTQDPDFDGLPGVRFIPKKTST